ncbi:MAG: FAD-binding oxidoreductase [Archangiaceae bacterium]|nr:FAD-binding oxidoreductase [Archangiaceae bacterium]
MIRSLWGWGVEGQLPDLQKTARRVEPLLGEVTPEAPAGGLSVPPPRAEVPREWAAFSTAEPRERAAHAWGKSYCDRVRGFRGDWSAAPDVVAMPANERELETVLEVAERERFSVTPFGGGSSVVAGVEPRLGPAHRAAVSLDLRRFDRVLEVDDVARAARIQAGVFGPALEAQLQASGFTLRHFPQSFEFSTLGGWIATRAGGHFATLYTHIDDLVEAVRMVTPRGLWATRRLPASGAGPQPERLVLGSEGTLGVITEAWMRVQPRPTFRAGASVHFAEYRAAIDACRAVAQAGLYPANCRLLDPTEVLMNEVAVDGTSVLVLAFESADHDVGPWLARALELARAHGGEPREKAAGDAWRAAFLKGPYLQDAMIALGVIADTFETACTWSAFPSLYERVNAAMSDALERVCGGGLVSCRFTHVYPDGPAPYFTFVGKAKRGAELDQWAELKSAAMSSLLAAGGTATHHHAVGRTHLAGWRTERPEPYARALAAMKRELDPAGLLNPGVLI